MSPLNISSHSGKVPTEFTELLELLGTRPQPAVVWYGPEGDRVELSGRVLSNWATKLIGLLDQEYELSEADAVVVDVALHWKAAAIALAVAAIGCGVRLGATASADDAQLVITDRPGAWTGSAAQGEEDELGEAELAAVSLGLLDSSFEEATGEQIPAWSLDISAEVRQYPDQLSAPLPAVPLPERAPDLPSPLTLTGWEPTSALGMFTVWAHAGVVVLFAGEVGGELWDQMRRNEGITAG